MKIKRYIQFIRESLKEDLDSKKIYDLDEDTIRDILIELEDAGYLITVAFGFVEKRTKNYYNKPSKEIEVYSEDILAGEEVKPAYWIQIERSGSVNNEDLTEYFKHACSIIEDQIGEIELHDGDSDVDINKILIEGGIFINVDPEDNMSGEESASYLAIFAKQKNTIKITQKDLENYYGWEVSAEKEGQLWAEIDLEDLSDIILSSRSSYKESLVKGQEYMWDYYEISGYYSDINSLLQYELNKENEILLVKALIKEMGGLKNVINHIGDECDDDIYELVKDMLEEELINYLLKERFYGTIKQLSIESEVFGEVKSDIANWKMSAHCDDNYDQIVSEFDSIVSKELGKFEKEVKEITKKYTTKDGRKVEYKDNITYYQFPYNNDWISDIDSVNYPQYLYNKDIDDIFRDWIREENISKELNPRISDWGNVDREKMNKDIKSYLTRYLSE